VDERNTLVEIQKLKGIERKHKEAEEKAKKQEKDQYLKLQRERNLYNIHRKADEATMTKDELEQHRLDKFFGLTQKMLAQMIERHMDSVFREWSKENSPAFYDSE
jgi:hypothetical protein